MEIAIVIVIAIGAAAAVLYPLLAAHRDAGVRLSEPALNEQVGRYRDAIKRGTLCERCLTANVAGSRFCAECGRALS